MTSSRIAALVLALWVGTGTAWAQSTPNLLTNGSFESQVVGAGNFQTYSRLTGWRTGSNGVEIRNNVAGSAFDGNQFIELDTDANSWISQSFSTVAGQVYQLSFMYANRTDQVSAASNGVAWSILTQSNATVISGNVGQDTNTTWRELVTTFVGNGNTMTFQLAAIGLSDGYGTSVDRARVSVVPEMPSAWMMLAGLAAVGGLMRRRMPG